MLIASNANLVPLPPDKAGQQMASPDSHFLPAPTLALLQGRSDPHLPFLPVLIQFWQVHLYFPSHLQKEPCKGLRAHVHACHADGGVDLGRAGVRQDAASAPACSSAELRGSNPPCQIFSCLHVCFCACQEPQTTRQTVCMVRDHLV